MHELFTFVLSGAHAVTAVGKYGMSLTEEKMEPCHYLFVTVVCDVFREIALMEFDKSVG
jgi:hypothetical protein